MQNYEEDCNDFYVCSSGLRQDYVSMPPASSGNQNTSCFNTTTENIEDHGNKVRARWPSALPSVGFSRCQSPATKPECQSPKQSRLHQQVTQFKLLKRAQNQGRTTGMKLAHEIKFNPDYNHNTGFNDEHKICFFVLKGRHIII